MAVERVGGWAPALPVVSLGAGRRGIGSASDVPNVLACITPSFIPRVRCCSGALVRAQGISHVVVVSELVPRFGLSSSVLRIAHSVFPFHCFRSVRLMVGIERSVPTSGPTISALHAPKGPRFIDLSTHRWARDRRRKSARRLFRHNAD